jgi:hypothetical protein
VDRSAGIGLVPVFSPVVRVSLLMPIVQGGRF